MVADYNSVVSTGHNLIKWSKSADTLLDLSMHFVYTSKVVGDFCGVARCVKLGISKCIEVCQGM